MADGDEWSLLLSLPNDVLEKIVLSPGLSLSDISCLCRTCWALNNVVSRLWPRLATLKWCDWGELKSTTNLEWYQLCKHRLLCEAETNKLLRGLTLKGTRTMITDEDDLDGLIAVMETCNNDVLSFVLDGVLHDPSDLTRQFYALYCKEKVVRLSILERWKELLALPTDQQLLEKGAVYFTQWMNPCGSVSMSAIVSQLDHIAEQVATELMQTGGQHTSDSECTKPDSVAALVAMKLPTERVLDCLNDVLFDKLGFRETSADHYYDLENSFIDKVLQSKVAIPISLCVVYSAVARRLGVSLQPLNFPRHFVLKLPKGGHGEEDIIIDVFARGRRLTADAFLLEMTHRADSGWEQFLVATEPVNVFKRMVANMFSGSQMSVGHNIERVIDDKTGEMGPLVFFSALNLRLHLCMLTPNVDLSLHDALYSALVFNEHHYSPCLVERIMSTIATEMTSVPKYEHGKVRTLVESSREMAAMKQELLESPPVVKHRPQQLLYSVGTLMKHRIYHYVCVIYGWDLHCEMGEGWVQQMGVDQLTRRRNQPFYKVLVTDGSNRYAAEDNLIRCPANEAAPISHWEVGKYFCKFTGQAYVPNFALSQQYPEDSVDSQAP